MKKTQLSILFLAFIFSPYFTMAQSFDTTRLNQFLDLLDKHHKAMVSVALVKDGSLAYSRAIGQAGADGQRSTPEHRYRIGSISKTFTAAIIFQLIEEGKLTLDTKLQQFFPQIPGADKISTDHLLLHRSGLYNFTNKPDYLTWHTKSKSKDEMLALIAASPLDFEPDSKTDYSNANYVLLGFMIEQIEGKSYAECLQERITGKIGLKNTYFGQGISPERMEAASFVRQEGKWQMYPDVTDMSIPHGAGALVATSGDLVLFMEALFGGKIISAKSLESMMHLRDGIGRGLFAVPFYSARGWGHNGGIDAFQSVLYHFPEEKITVAICANGLEYPLNDVLIGVLSIGMGKAFPMPDFSKKEVQLGASDLAQYTGTYTSAGFPLKITVSVTDGKLMAQATGQSAFPLEPTGEHRFSFEMAGITMEFKSSEKLMTLTQAGQRITFSRED
jgi:D-alanyl-D-alanine carboxypeptidase